MIALIDQVGMLVTAVVTLAGAVYVLWKVAEKRQSEQVKDLRKAIETHKGELDECKIDRNKLWLDQLELWKIIAAMEQTSCEEPTCPGHPTRNNKYVKYANRKIRKITETMSAETLADLDQRIDEADRSGTHSP